ncbi:MAG: hypothetical protein ABH857_03705 [Elusimicrobiota bacterium]
MKNIIKKIVIALVILAGVIFLLKSLVWFKGISEESKPEVLDKYFESMTDSEGWVMKERGLWEKSEAVGYEDKDIRPYEKENVETGIIESGYEGLDFFKSYNQEGNSYNNDPVVFIGEWEYDKQLDTEIRIVKRQGLMNGSIRSSFETKDDINKDIPSKPLELIRENNMPFGGRGITKAENDKIVEALRAQGYIVEE